MGPLLWVLIKEGIEKDPLVTGVVGVNTDVPVKQILYDMWLDKDSLAKYVGIKLEILGIFYSLMTMILSLYSEFYEWIEKVQTYWSLIVSGLNFGPYRLRLGEKYWS